MGRKFRRGREEPFTEWPVAGQRRPWSGEIGCKWLPTGWKFSKGSVASNLAQKHGYTLKDMAIFLSVFFPALISPHGMPWRNLDRYVYLLVEALTVCELAGKGYGDFGLKSRWFNRLVEERRKNENWVGWHVFGLIECRKDGKWRAREQSDLLAARYPLMFPVVFEGKKNGGQVFATRGRVIPRIPGMANGRGEEGREEEDGWSTKRTMEGGKGVGADVGRNWTGCGLGNKFWLRGAPGQHWVAGEFPDVWDRVPTVARNVGEVRSRWIRRKEAASVAKTLIKRELFGAYVDRTGGVVPEWAGVEDAKIHPVVPESTVRAIGQRREVLRRKRYAHIFGGLNVEMDWERWFFFGWWMWDQAVERVRMVGDVEYRGLFDPRGNRSLPKSVRACLTGSPTLPWMRSWGLAGRVRETEASENFTRYFCPVLMEPPVAVVRTGSPEDREKRIRKWENAVKVWINEEEGLRFKTWKGKGLGAKMSEVVEFLEENEDRKDKTVIVSGLTGHLSKKIDPLMETAANLSPREKKQLVESLGWETTEFCRNIGEYKMSALEAYLKAFPDRSSNERTANGMTTRVLKDDRVLLAIALFCLGRSEVARQAADVKFSEVYSRTMEVFQMAQDTANAKVALDAVKLLAQLSGHLSSGKGGGGFNVQINNQPGGGSSLTGLQPSNNPTKLEFIEEDEREELLMLPNNATPQEKRARASLNKLMNIMDTQEKKMETVNLDVGDLDFVEGEVVDG